MADIQNIRTFEDLTNAVSQLYFNLNNIERLYYTIFIDPEPKENVELERYDENGQLGVITLKNRAADIRVTITGAIDPNGNVSAALGTFYLNTTTGTLWYKAQGSSAADNQGWAPIQSQGSIGEEYLKKDGDGSQLKNISTAIGVLGVDHGGTGTTNIAGLVKANGIGQAYTAAIKNADYLAPDNFIGGVIYYAGTAIPDGWLVCNGAGYKSSDYPLLYNKIGTKYGSGTGSGTDFCVPNISNGRFIKGGTSATLGITETAAVQNHIHNFTVTDTHSHTKGTMRIQGTFSGVGNQSNVTLTGAFYNMNDSSKGVPINNSGSAGKDNYFGFDTDINDSWTGSTSSYTLNFTGSTVNPAGGVAKNTVDNITLIPIIRAR